jgi:fused signal recognition particle receptor
MDNIFLKWKHGLEKTRKATFGKIVTLFGASEITNATWEELETQLIQADLGMKTTESIITSIKNKIEKSGVIHSVEFKTLLKDELISRLIPRPDVDFSAFHPAVILLVGVNGSGKTTTAAKLGKVFANQGKKVLLGAADTYRAAAIDQLEVWANRLTIPIIAGQPDADPGAVAYDTVQAAIARKMDYVIIDTAGRLHTRYNLMEELKKVSKVVSKALPGAPHACWLVMDSTTGQNALTQAKEFLNAVNVSGIIMAKMDTSAKGGMAFSIQQELNLPILFVGLGEQPDDLLPFDRESFVNGIIDSNYSEG